MVKLSTRLGYRQLHRCKANYEFRTVETGTNTAMQLCRRVPAHQDCTIRS